jgi:hypothetical protein
MKAKPLAPKLKNYKKNAAGCWIWQGMQSHDGYGRVRYKCRKIRAHRAVMLVKQGFLTPGKIVCHTCDERLCVNPDHLYEGSQADNMRDAACRRSIDRRRGEDHQLAKLMEADVFRIRRSKETTRALGKRYGVGKSTIQQIKAGETWKHLLEE